MSQEIVNFLYCLASKKPYLSEHELELIFKRQWARTPISKEINLFKNASEDYRTR